MDETRSARRGRLGGSTGVNALLAALALVLPAIAAPPATAADETAAPAEGRPIPVSCLYRHSGAGDGAAKAGAVTRIEGMSVYPALAEKFRGAPADSMTILVILLQWFDYTSFSGGTSATYESFVKQRLRPYYLEVSQNRFHIGGVATVWLEPEEMYHYFVNADRASGTADDYGFDFSDIAFTFDPAMNVWGLARAAARKADEWGVDFTRYDNDGPDGIPSSRDDDGVVDAIIIVHAGVGAETLPLGTGSDFIWSHKSDLNDPAITNWMGATVLDGVKIGPYLFVPENGELGVFAHEFGHILGLPDVYGTFVEDGTTVQVSMVGAYCLMDGGGLIPLTAQDGGVAPGSVPTHINPIFKEWLGWLEPTPYERGLSSVSSFPGLELSPVVTSGEAVRLLENPGGVDWDRAGGGSGEYFVLELRNDRTGYDNYLPAEGLVVWHADETHDNNNSRSASGRLVSLVKSDPGNSGLGVTDLGSGSDVWPNGAKRDWTPDSDPSTARYGGGYTGLAVRNMELTPGGGGARFDLDLLEEPAGELIVYPNPFRPHREDEITVVFRPAGAADGSGENMNRLTIDIFDMTGTPVRRVTAEGAASSDWSASWDGRNNAGREVATGVYFLVARAGGETATGKVAIVR